MAKILIKSGRVIDAANNIDAIQDVLIENSRIAKAAERIEAQADERIDARGKIVMPGIVDMHVHLREPGREDKETVESATQAALMGGVTSVLAMPNTDPAIDSVASIRLLKNIIRQTAKANVFIAAAITKGRQGKELTDIPQLKREGAIAITDDGASVDDAALFSRALKKAKQNKMPVICHCEDTTLSAGGAVNAGICSIRMGLRGISKEAEYKRVERDIRLAEKASCPVHIAHVSCAESIQIIERAKKKRVKVTCETAPHYFSLSEEAVLGYNTNAKVNPPLRSRADVQAIKQALASGIIDVIASDHAPHTENEKDIEFERAEFGIIGLQTQLAVSISELINRGILDWKELVKKLCLHPAKILGLDKGSLSAGKPADIIIIDPAREWQVSAEDSVSKSKNSAFLGKKLFGVVEYTICGGKIAFKA